MARYLNYESGHSRGGVDVTEAVNLVFKGLLLSPIFMLCIFVTIAMLKHMIFGGVPTMHQPTEQQQQQIRERDAQLDVAPATPLELRGDASRTPQATQPQVVIEQPMQEVYINRPTIHELPPVYNLDSNWNTNIQVDPFQ